MLMVSFLSQVTKGFEGITASGDKIQKSGRWRFDTKRPSPKKASRRIGIPAGGLFLSTDHGLLKKAGVALLRFFLLR